MLKKSSDKQNKKWFNSRTIKLMLAELFGVAGSYFSGSMELIPAILLAGQSVAGIVLRFYTDAPVDSK